MTAIANLQSTSIFFEFEQAMRQQLETQESEMRDQFKREESGVRELKVQKTVNDRIVEELRPLCEGLPDCALDPVTYEPLEKAMVTECSHTFNWSTINHAIDSIGGMQEVKKLNGMACPVCRWKFSPSDGFFPCGSIRDMVEIFKTISEVFKRNVTPST